MLLTADCPMALCADPAEVRVNPLFGLGPLHMVV